MSVNEAVSAERNNGHTAARHSDRCFVACSLEWDDVSLSSAATAIAASDCDITLAAITANVLTLLNATGASATIKPFCPAPPKVLPCCAAPPNVLPCCAVPHALPVQRIWPAARFGGA